MATLQELKPLDYNKTESVWILQTSTVLNHIATLQFIPKGGFVKAKVENLKFKWYIFDFSLHIIIFPHSLVTPRVQDKRVIFGFELSI